MNATLSWTITGRSVDSETPTSLRLSARADPVGQRRRAVGHEARVLRRRLRARRRLFEGARAGHLHRHRRHLRLPYRDRGRLCPIAGPVSALPLPQSVH